jgi:predicted phage terminase large subunit-like protein
MNFQEFYNKLSHSSQNIINNWQKQGMSNIEVLKRIKGLKENELIRQARDDFSIFSYIICKELFAIINLEEKWIKVLFKQLKLLGDPVHKNFLLNSCPRLGKTFVMSILYPCWLIGKNPKLKILILSASEQMRADTGMKIKIILKNDIYKKIFNEIEFISMGSEIKQTTQMGNITLLSSGTNLTGAGFNIVIGDDFFNPTELSTQHHITRQIFLENALGRKEHEPKTIYIIAEQTLSLNDTTHLLKEKWKESEYIQLILPYQFDEQASKIFQCDFDDVKFALNEFISPRFHEDAKDLIIRERGIETFLTQYQQIPQDSKEIIIKREWWNYYNHSYNMLDLRHTFFTCDIAHTETKKSDYSVICCWGICKQNKLYLIDMIRDKKEYVEIRQLIINFINKYKHFIILENQRYASYKCLYIEGMANSKATISDLKTLGIVIKEIPRKENKYARMSIIGPEIQQGKVYLPLQRMELANLVIEECVNFRKDDRHLHDDICDNVADAIIQELKGSDNFNYDVFSKLI